LVRDRRPPRVALRRCLETKVDVFRMNLAL